MKESAIGLLERIVKAKEREVAAITGDPLNGRTLLEVPSFYKALKRPLGQPIRVIAECKKASPSRGLLRADYDPGRIAAEYARLGASAISVLTDRDFFQGDLSHIKEAAGCGLPIIRKDFIISELQIAEARVAGASAVLLIVRILSPVRLKALLDYAYSIGLDVLTEIHNEDEARLALEAGARIIGINHRDLDTLEMDLSLSGRIAPLIRGENSDIIIVAESGVESASGRKMMEPIADAILIGSALMESDDRASRWKDIFSNP